MTYGKIADKYINQLNDFYYNITVDRYVIMPNHIYIMLFVPENGASRTSPPTVGVRLGILLSPPEVGCGNLPPALQGEKMSERPMNEMRDRLNSALFEARHSAIREFSLLARKTPGCIALTLGEPDVPTEESVCGQLQAALEAGETHYIENNGSPDLRRAIAEFERDKNGMDYSPDEVIVTAGATGALFTALFGILDPGDQVIVPIPAFGLYREIITLCRGEFVPLYTGEDGFQISPERLEAVLTPRTKAIILNSPNNPTGVVYNRESLETVKRAAAKRRIFVICDDVYRQLVYTDSYHSFAEYRGLRDRILVAQSFSKPYAMTGWRMGYLLADKAVKERLELIHQYTVVSTPSLFQRPAVRALKTSAAAFVAACRRRRDVALGRLSEIGLPVTKPEGAFYVFPDISAFGLSSADFCRRMISEAGLAATPGFCFGDDSRIRLSVCAPDEDLREGMRRLGCFIEHLKKEAAE